MQTDLLTVSTTSVRKSAIAAAVELLRKGEVVALPTETVYGLGADAQDPIAVAKIFEAKGRPRFDPLIVHLPNRDWLEKITDVPAKASSRSGYRDCRFGHSRCSNQRTSSLC